MILKKIDIWENSRAIEINILFCRINLNDNFSLNFEWIGGLIQKELHCYDIHAIYLFNLKKTMQYEIKSNQWYDIKICLKKYIDVEQKHNINNS